MLERIARATATTSLAEGIALVVTVAGLVISLVGVGLDWPHTTLIATATVILAVLLAIRAKHWAVEVERRRRETERQLHRERRLAADALSETQQYRAQLTRMFIDDFQISEEQEVVYTLSGGSSDRYRINATTTPQSSERCRWRRIRVQGGGPSTEIRAQLLSGGAKLLELDDDPGYWSGLVLFDPPIDPGDSRQWSLDLLWPRMADPLRENGTDSIWFYTEIPVPLATVKVKYTQDWMEKYGAPPTSFTQRSPDTGEVTHENVLGDSVITWRIENVQVRQHYMAYLSRTG